MRRVSTKAVVVRPVKKKLRGNRVNTRPVIDPAEDVGHSETSVEKAIAGMGRLAWGLVRTLAVGSVVIFLPGAVQRIKRMHRPGHPTCSPALIVLFVALMSQLLVDPGDTIGRLFSVLPSSVAPEDAALLVNDGAVVPLQTVIVVGLVGFAALAVTQLLLMRCSRSDQRAWGLWVAMHMVAGLVAAVLFAKYATADSDSWGAVAVLVLCIPAALMAGAGARNAYRRWRLEKAWRVLGAAFSLLGAVLGASAALGALVGVSILSAETGDLVRRAAPKKQGEGMRAAVAHGGHICFNVDSASGRITCRVALLPRTDRTLLVWGSPPAFATLMKSGPDAVVAGSDTLRLGAQTNLPALRNSEIPLQVRKDAPLIVDIQLDVTAATCRDINLLSTSKHVVTVDGVFPVGTHQLDLPNEQLLHACAAVDKAKADRKKTTSIPQAARDRREAGTAQMDELIETTAAKRVREQLGSKVQVGLNSYNRVVLITGEASSEEARNELEGVVAGVADVARVLNEVAVRDQSSPASLAHDVLLAAKIKATFLDASDLAGTAFSVVVRRGVVYLMGRATKPEASRASDLCRQIGGVAKVVTAFEIISDVERDQFAKQASRSR
jgi:osmotically-inducible protein OsmY